MTSDPIIEEIHAIRIKLMAEAGGDLHEVIRRARAHHDASRTVVKGEPRRPVGWVDQAVTGKLSSSVRSIPVP